MIRRSIIILMFVIAAGSAAPASAAVKILPDCDETIYLVQKENSTGEICSQTQLSGCTQLSPQEYNAKSADFQKNNPPIITTNRNCGFNDFVQLFINLANFGLGILAALALLVTVWGGFTMLTSMGNPEKIKEGKLTIWGGVLGISIVLTSWVLIGFFVAATTGTGNIVFKDAAGGIFARQFFGKGSCLATYKACSTTNLHLQCRDDTKINGDAVSQLQGTLSNLNCYKASIDGCFGPKTDAAVRNFLQANQGCNIALPDAGTFSIPDYRIVGGSPEGIADDTVWAFIRGASQNIQINCPPFLLGPEPVRRC